VDEARQAIWDDYYTKVVAVAKGSGHSAALARGIAPSDAHAEAKEIYPRLRAERDARLRQLSQQGYQQ